MIDVKYFKLTHKPLKKQIKKEAISSAHRPPPHRKCVSASDTSQRTHTQLNPKLRRFSLAESVEAELLSYRDRKIVHFTGHDTLPAVTLSSSAAVHAAEEEDTRQRDSDHEVHPLTASRRRR